VAGIYNFYQSSLFYWLWKEIDDNTPTIHLEILFNWYGGRASLVVLLWVGQISQLIDRRYLHGYHRIIYQHF
jgi:hypothetical protein